MDLIENPLQTIDAWFHEERKKPELEGKMPKEWRERERMMEMLSGDLETKIPSLNTVSLVEHLPLRSLVRYRGMVQEIISSEVYAAVLQDGNNIHTLKYRDICMSASPIDFNAEPSLMNRDVYYCVPLPGETPWAREAALKESSPTYNHCPNPGAATTKRGREEDVKDETMASTGRNIDMNVEEVGGRGGDGKKDEDVSMEKSAKKTAMEENKAEMKEKKGAGNLHYNLSLPWEEKPQKTRCVILKNYDREQNFLIHDIVEIIGVLHVDNYEPLPSNSLEDAHTSYYAHIPRLHALSITKLPYYNPAPLLQLPPHGGDGAVGLERAVLCEKLQQYLATGLGGDMVAAKYMLYGLIQREHKRMDEKVFGCMSVCFQIEKDNVDRFVDVCTSLMPRVAHLPMTIDSLHNHRWVLKKNYETDIVESGLLQLSSGTCVILDETKLVEGKLNPPAFKALTHIGNYVKTHQYQGEFEYCDVFFPTRHSVFVLSTGKKPILGPDIVVPKPEAKSSDISSTPYSPPEQPDERLLGMFRSLISTCVAHGGNQNITFSDQVTTQIPQDFVKVRKEYKNVSPDVCHHWLVMVKLETLLHGDTKTLTKHWESVLSLEHLRLDRLLEKETKM